MHSSSGFRPGTNRASPGTCTAAAAGHKRSGNRAAPWWVCILLAFLAGPVAALEALTLELAGVEGPGWQARDIAIRLELPPGAAAGLEVTIGSVSVPGVDRRFENLLIACPEMNLGGQEASCARGKLGGVLAELGPQDGELSFKYIFHDRRADLRLEGLRLASGEARIEGSWAQAGWSLRVGVRQANLEELAGLLAPGILEKSGLTANGKLRFDIGVNGRDANPDELVFDARLTELTGSDEPGTMATEQLSASLAGRMVRRGPDWQLRARAEQIGGLLYVEPIFLDLSEAPPVLSLAGLWRSASRELILKDWRLSQPGIIEARGEADLVLAQGEEPSSLRSLQASLSDINLDRFFPTYVRPMLFGTSLAEIQARGGLDVQLRVSDDTLAEVLLRPRELDIVDPKKRFGLVGGTGRVHWSASAGGPNTTGRAKRGEISRISWQSGSIFGMPVGSASLSFQTGGRRFEFDGTQEIPLLDGLLRINILTVDGGTVGETETGPDLQIDAELEPVSLEDITRALDWPVFAGTISGRLPLLNYSNGELVLGGTLEAQAFDGKLSIEKLRISQPFGNLPQLFANVAISDLDLEQLTSTYAFGRITGRLEGEVSDLHLLNWSPVAFDGWLRTPADDRSKRRISQRAIENISSLSGGGAGAALSGGVMKFFDDFAYDRLGVSCRLLDGVCEMNGIAPFKNGYYIVKGRGLPRIDVIGYATRVDWTRLVEQLKALSESGDAVLQ